MTFDFDEGEFPILGSFARLDSAQVFGDGIQYVRGATEHARSRRANLDKIGSNWLSDRERGLVLAVREFGMQNACVPVEHGVKSRDFIHAHGGQLEHLRDIVHDADACPSLILALPKVKERNDSRFLVLGRVACYNLLRTLQVLGSELKGDL